MNVVELVAKNHQKNLLSENQYKIQIPEVKKKLNRPLYATINLWINSNTYMTQYLNLTPSELRVLGFLNKKQQGNILFRCDDRLIASAFKNQMSRRTIQSALKGLRDKGLIITTSVKDFSKLKEAFDLKIGYKSRLIQVVMPNHIEVESDRANSFELQGRCMIGKKFGIETHEVDLEMVTAYCFNYDRLDIPQVSQGVQFFAYHICYGRDYHNLNNKIQPTKGLGQNLSLKDFPITLKSNLTNRKDYSKAELRSSSSDSLFQKFLKMGKRKKGKSFPKKSDLNKSKRFTADDAIANYPHEYDEFSCDEEFVEWLVKFGKLSFAHAWAFLMCVRSVVMLHGLIDNPIDEARQRFIDVCEKGKKLSEVIGYTDYKVEFVENSIAKGGKLGKIPDSKQTDMFVVDQDIIDAVSSMSEKDIEVGNVSKSRLERLKNHEDNSLIKIETRRQQAESQRAIKKAKQQGEREFSEVNANEKVEKSMASVETKHFFELWDFELGGDSNLTKRGAFIKFSLAINEEAKKRKWHKSWKWHVVKRYYHLIKQHQMGQAFKSDVMVYSSKDKQTMNAIGNIKKAIDKFSFIEYMEILYYLLNDPEDVYAYGFFASEFKLVKMTKYDRILKVQSIMTTRNYWDDAKLFIESEGEIEDSASYREEARMQSLAQLNDIERAEFLTLEKEIEKGDSEYMRLDTEVDNAKDRLDVLKDYLASYNANLSRFEANVAENFTKEMFEVKGHKVPTVYQASEELKELPKEIKLKVKEMKKYSDLDAKRERLQELKND